MSRRWLAALVLAAIVAGPAGGVAWAQPPRRCPASTRSRPTSGPWSSATSSAGATCRPRSASACSRTIASGARSPPSERKSARENFQRFRALPPQERRRILEDFRRWNELPEARRQELQHAYERFQRLPPERRERILERFRQFQQLPPEERQRVMDNYERWQRMTPEERARVRERCGACPGGARAPRTHAARGRQRLRRERRTRRARDEARLRARPDRLRCSPRPPAPAARRARLARRGRDDARPIVADARWRTSCARDVRPAPRRRRAREGDGPRGLARAPARARAGSTTARWSASLAALPTLTMSIAELQREYPRPDPRRARRATAAHVAAGDSRAGPGQAAGPHRRRAAGRAAWCAPSTASVSSRRSWSTSGSTTSTSSPAKGECAGTCPTYERDVIRPHALGQFRDLLRGERAPPRDALLSRQLAEHAAGLRGAAGGPTAAGKPASTRTTRAS